MIDQLVSEAASIITIADNFPVEYLDNIRNKAGGMDSPILRRWIEVGTRAQLAGLLAEYRAKLKPDCEFKLL